MDKEKGFVSAVVYVHNCEAEIRDFLMFLTDFFSKCFEHSEIVCVNDYSSDGSVTVIKQLSRQIQGTQVTLLNLSYFHGLELAMNAGMDLAIGDYVFEFDTTFRDYAPQDIIDVYHKELSGFDIVSASSDLKGRPSSRLFYKLFSRYSSYTEYELKTESFRVLSRRVINRIGHMNKTVPYRKAVYASSGLKCANIVYKSAGKPRRNLESREKSVRQELAVDSLLLFTNIGYRFSLFMTISMLTVTLFVTIYSIIAYIISNPVEGWTSTVLFLAVVFTGLFIISAIIIKYLQLILLMVFRRQTYSFESVEKLTDKDAEVSQ